MDKFNLTRNGHAVGVVNVVDLCGSGRTTVERWSGNGNEVWISKSKVGSDDTNLPFFVVAIGIGNSSVRVVRYAKDLYDAQHIFDYEVSLVRNP